MQNLTQTNIYTISELNAETRDLLDTHFGSIWVIGEISNLSRPSSGHLYFSLKDSNAQIRCALFRFQHQQIDFTVENGQQVIVYAEVSLYETRGDYQLIVSQIQLAGEGKLQLAFEQLKKQLEKAGWFDEKHKKPLPLLPKQIGIITSPTGAALQDILKVLKKRFPSIPVIIYPTAVQGNAATPQIAQAITRANQHAQCDIVILARGGGSLEDLWCFNEKTVAQAIFDSHIPIITGIGHQTDFTIADFVADYRAPTPSAAAEIASPDQADYRNQLSQKHGYLSQQINAILRTQKQCLSHLQKRLKHPGEKLQQQAQQLDQVETTLSRLMRFILQNKQQQISHAAHALDTLSPLKVLQRGYSITYKKTGSLLKSVHDLFAGEQIVTRIADGEVTSIVETVDILNTSS